ncbi:putative 4-hydroxy-3-methylbut-2-enyl diphosphate reductase [Helianthus annuus]|nr:putative 4-hydroxy-3-methylbut-2-enyl diphosphate reductase [Helianthus annuus]
MLKDNNNEYTWGNVTVKLAKAYGFCYGVEHAIRIAYETRIQFPDHEMWITNEIIHNPTVNKRLEEMEVKIIPVENGEKQFDVVDKGAVVILPAFGAAVNEMLTLNNKQVQIVDTTCPWVSKSIHIQSIKLYIHSTKKQLLYQYISTKNKYFFSLLSIK